MDILLRFKNPLVIQLMVIAIVSLATAQEASDTASAVVVGAMVVLSVGLGFFQERKSGKAVEKLQEMVETNCVVIRDGKEAEIPMVEIVPGDLVVLHAGAIIPADLRLLTTKIFHRAIGVDGRVHAGGKERRGVQPGGQGHHRTDERVFPGEQCHQRHGAGGGGEHGQPDVFWVHLREAGGPAGGDEF